MDNTGKFTHKVVNYVKYRPSYPDAFIRYLFDEVGFSADACVADIGAGTGILTEPLAESVKTIYAIEPNRSMRLSCMNACGRNCSFVALDGTAEDTGLPDDSVDFVTVGQAFHWFDRHRAQQEFARILKPDGLVVLVWNTRVPDAPAVVALGDICRKHCPAFSGFSGGQETALERFVPFFRDGICEARTFPNDRRLSKDAFVGSTLSSSYAPLPGHASFSPFVADLETLFDQYAENGQIVVPMCTLSYIGRI